MRYTEAVRMAKITQEMLADIDKETVDFMPNYDESLQELTVLPAKIPNLHQWFQRYRRRDGDKYSTAQLQRGMQWPYHASYR